VRFTPSAPLEVRQRALATEHRRSLAGRRSLAELARRNGLAAKAPAGPLQERDARACPARAGRGVQAKEPRRGPRNTAIASPHCCKRRWDRCGSIPPALARLRVDESAPVERPAPEELRAGAHARALLAGHRTGQDCEGVIPRRSGLVLRFVQLRRRPAADAPAGGRAVSGEHLWTRRRLPASVHPRRDEAIGDHPRCRHSWSHKAAPAPFDEEAASGSSSAPRRSR